MFNYNDRSLLTVDMLCKESLRIMYGLLAHPPISIRPLACNDLLWSPCKKEAQIRYSGLDMRCGIVAIDRDAVEIRAQIGNQIVSRIISPFDLTLDLEAFSSSHIRPMLRRFSCVIKAEQRMFKLARMKAKATARNWRTPWIKLHA